MLKNNRLSKIKDLKDNGEKIAGVFCSYTPLEILDAAGIGSINLSSYEDEFVKYSEVDLPRNLCPLVKSSYGAIISDNNDFAKYIDLVLGEASCDGKKKMYELLNNHMETYILQLPQGVDRPYSKPMWESEIRYLIKYLEEKFDVEITEEKIRDAAILRNKVRSLYNELFSLSKLDPPLISGYDTLEIINDLSFNTNLEERYEELRTIIDSIKTQYESSPKNESKPKRILVTGCPVGGLLEKVVSPIEDGDAFVVCFDNCNGIKLSRNLVDTDSDDIVKAISDSYLNIGCAIMSPDVKRMEVLPQLIEEYKVDAVVDVALQTCHSYSIEQREVASLMKDLDIPYLTIETDYSEANAGQIKTRISAFLEMI